MTANSQRIVSARNSAMESSARQQNMTVLMMAMAGVVPETHRAAKFRFATCFPFHKLPLV
jgi:hypothetical protein